MNNKDFITNNTTYTRCMLVLLDHLDPCHIAYLP
jgi:hypothetical protein